MNLLDRFRWLTLSLALVMAIPSIAIAEGVRVFAAASLKNALDNVARAWRDTSGRQATMAYAGSATLARQLEQGAPADLYISANEDWMDYLDERGLLRSESRFALLGNRIVLIVPKENRTDLVIGPGMDLASVLGETGRLAIANTDSVPAGQYGKAALQSLGIWESVMDHIVESENVRLVLGFVARGEAPLGIVYATDAAAEPGVKVLGAFPTNSHPPIRYPAAILAESANPDAEAFMEFLVSPAARGAFEQQGFSVLAEERAGS